MAKSSLAAYTLLKQIALAFLLENRCDLNPSSRLCRRINPRARRVSRGPMCMQAIVRRAQVSRRDPLALGCNGAAGTAHPLATLDGPRDVEARRQCCGCRDRRQCLLGVLRADRLRTRRRLFRLRLGSDTCEGGRTCRIGPFTEIFEPGDGARALDKGGHPGIWRHLSLHAGCARWVVGTAPALRQAQVGAIFRARHPTVRERRTGAANHQLLPRAKPYAVPAIRLAGGRNGERHANLCAVGPAASRRRCVQQPGS